MVQPVAQCDSRSGNSARSSAQGVRPHPPTKEPHRVIAIPIGKSVSFALVSSRQALPNTVQQEKRSKHEKNRRYACSMLIGSWVVCAIISALMWSEMLLDCGENHRVDAVGARDIAYSFQNSIFYHNIICGCVKCKKVSKGHASCQMARRICNFWDKSCKKHQQKQRFVNVNEKHLLYRRSNIYQKDDIFKMLCVESQNRPAQYGWLLKKEMKWHLFWKCHKTLLADNADDELLMCEGSEYVGSLYSGVIDEDEILISE